jgi:Rieske Fe-S protein
VRGRRYHVHFDKVRPEVPDFTPVRPQRVAALTELEPLWSAVPFTLADDGSGETPAVALRVPEAVTGGVSLDGRHYLAFSRICTHLGCVVNLNSDLETLAVAFNFRTDQPALACPCHLSVFSPLQAGRAVSAPPANRSPGAVGRARRRTLCGGARAPAQLILCRSGTLH